MTAERGIRFLRRRFQASHVRLSFTRSVGCGIEFPEWVWYNPLHTDGASEHGPADYAEGGRQLKEQTAYYRFFQNRKCEYFPCHEGVDEAEFNCLFCFCPLYALGKRCGGRCQYTKEGNKDCSACTFPHQRENYDRVIDRYGEIMDAAKRSDEAIIRK